MVWICPDDSHLVCIVPSEIQEENDKQTKESEEAEK